ncbi:MAG: hypothetical protein GXP25_11280 [Planctomycetes bacterium]|nr:hypothetical protein [Planctomycetota bacterium]
MKAGFAKVCITPPMGTRMYGFAGRDKGHGCEGVHDGLFVRAVYLSDEKEQALIMGFDLLFFGREDANRFKGAIGNKLDLAPRQILLNTSHTHCGPMTGATWGYADYGHGVAERLYLDELEQAIVQAACKAKEAARPVTVEAGAGKSTTPVSRRKPDGKGGVTWAPYRDGVTCDDLPVCLFKDHAGKAVCLLFSISCHPSTISGYEISADYPGPAMDALDKHFGVECSLFLQGCGGDAKASVIGQGDKWRGGTWDEVADAGRTAAKEVIETIDAGLTPVEPGIRSSLIEMHWPLQELPTREDLEVIASDEKGNEIKRLWAKRQIERLDRGQMLRASVPVLLHGIALGKGLRLVALEGEAVAGLGLHIQDCYKGSGITFPLSYTDGMAMYLPTSAMIDEGGYEVVSYHEYGQPAGLAKGMEEIITGSLTKMEQDGGLE